MTQTHNKTSQAYYYNFFFTHTNTSLGHRIGCKKIEKNVAIFWGYYYPPLFCIGSKTKFYRREFEPKIFVFHPSLYHTQWHKSWSQAPGSIVSSHRRVRLQSKSDLFDLILINLATFFWRIDSLFDFNIGTQSFVFILPTTHKDTSLGCRLCSNLFLY